MFYRKVVYRLIYHVYFLHFVKTKEANTDAEDAYPAVHPPNSPRRGQN